MFEMLLLKQPNSFMTILNKDGKFFESALDDLIGERITSSSMYNVCPYNVSLYGSISVTADAVWSGIQSRIDLLPPTPKKETMFSKCGTGGC